MKILLINPNTSGDTTAMMVAIARSCVPDGIVVTGATATRGPPMITTQAALAAAAAEVVEIGIREAAGVSGIIVGAFGDPGLETLRRNVSIPAVGICEASMIEAAAGGRRFGVATVTPDLAAPITERARDLGLLHLFTGIRLTPGDPLALTADPCAPAAVTSRKQSRRASTTITRKWSSSAAVRSGKPRSASRNRSSSPSLHRFPRPFGGW